MPGHVKLGKPGEADPDPAPYLIVSLEMKREDQLKPYDPRKSYWAPDGNGGYKEATLVDGDIEKEGAKCTVMIGHEVSNIQLLSFSRTQPIIDPNQADTWYQNHETSLASHTPSLPFLTYKEV